MFDKKLGYYSCNGQEFSSKINACLYSVQVKKPINWHFNDEVFNSIDWSIEPTETLDELYDQRARELREQYEYIIISYSGGSDSHNILVSFLRQGLHVDEVIINTMDKGTRKSTEININNKENKNAAAEYDLQTFPRLKELEQISPTTKITVVDLTDHLFSSLEKTGDGSWILEKREGVNIAGATRFNYIHFNEIRKTFDKEKRIALIVGLDKPRTWIKDNIFYVGFNDRAANIITVAEHIKDYTNSSVEFFYWSPSCVKMMIKQVHVIKKYVEAFPENRKYWDLALLPDNYNKIYRILHERILRTLIYTTWDENWYQADKALKDWYSEFDAWFYEGHTDTKAYHIWMEGLKYMEHTLSPYLRKDSEIADGLIVFIHPYKVDKMNFKIEI